MTHTPWTWERVEGNQYVTEHTLNGPDVLCRYETDRLNLENDIDQARAAIKAATSE